MPKPQRPLNSDINHKSFRSTKEPLKQHPEYELTNAAAPACPPRARRVHVAIMHAPSVLGRQTHFS